jgi:radical SAM protein with 4Fe4S-binding SPASM domain
VIPKPFYAVWEITLKCNLACRHCGSRAGRARPGELSTQEALGVVDQLAKLGVQEVTLIGGEAYLREDWDVILRAIADRGMRPSITTGGRGLDRERARRAREANVQLVSVSIDGLEEVHDWQRGVKGSYRAALEALDHLRDEGIRTGANTQINRLSFPDLDPLADVLIDKGVQGWQVALTAALGRAADWPEILLQPYDILEVVPKIAELKERCDAAGMTLAPDNGIGYFGPYEQKIRSRDGRALHWEGCGAGCSTIGIEADGTFKGCPSLPTAPYAAGDLKKQSMQEIWAGSPALLKLRRASRRDLWGFCGGCYYADVCRGGCTFTAHALLGRPGNQPYCYHRAEQLRARGARETLSQVRAAPGVPFDHGVFELKEEPLPPDPGISWEDRREELFGKLSGLPKTRIPV